MLTVERSDHGTNKRAIPMPYIGSLDGLRAIAVLAVLLYHDNLSWARGGFLGVEVFFVISGYLITSILLGRHRATGTVDLKGFWIGRARRLLPALYLMLAVVAAWWLLFYPSLVGKLKGQFLGGALYFTNWYLVFAKVSYFSHMGRPSPLIHLWSLAVEEQFYLLWPLALWGLLKLFKGRPLPLLSTIFGAALLSSLVMAVLYHSGHDPSSVYYGTETRASGLLIGAALAVVWRPWLSRRRPNRRRGVLADAGGLFALAILVLFFAFATEQGAFLYRGGFLLLDFTTALLIAACVTKSNRVLRSRLGAEPLVWVGQRSYGIYLWHWPIFAVLQPGTISGLPLFILRLLVTMVVATASYRYVETPFRKGLVRDWIARWRAAEAERQRALSLRAAGGAGALACAVVLLVVGVAVHAPGKTQLQIELEQAARNPANHSGAASIGLRSPPATGPPPSVEPASTATTTAPTTTTAPPATTATTQPATVVVPTTAPPPTTAAPALGPLAIGDSVMLGAANALRAAIPGIRVDAVIGRQWNAGVALAQANRAAGTLGNTVIIGLGNNGTVTAAGFNAMMAALAGVPNVVVIDVRVDRSWQNSDNAVLRAGVTANPTVHFVDWFTYSAGHTGWFYDDGTHLRPAFAGNYAALVASVLKPAA
jgi:peptidoglycan/LPS O-acetylase OafA/YrhL